MIRGKKKSFTTIYNSVLQDRRLSLKTIGLFAIMQSFPEDWEYSVSGLSARAGIGRDGVRNCLRELEEAGYLLREQAHQENGKFACSTYVLQDQAPPSPEKPSTAKPSTVKPTTVFQPQVNKQVSNKTSNNPPISPQGDAFETFWMAYPKKRAKAAARKAWIKLSPDANTRAEIMRALSVQRRSQEWQREDGRFIPYPATWINQRRWEDEVETKPAAKEARSDGEVYGWQR